MNKAGIVFLAPFFSFRFSIEFFHKNFIRSELPDQPIHNSITIDLITDTEVIIRIEFGFASRVFPILARMINYTTADVIYESDFSATDL